MKIIEVNGETWVRHWFKWYLKDNKHMAGIDDELEKLLDSHAEYYIRQTMKFFQNEGESPALSKNNEGDLAAKTKLKALLTTQQQELLDRVMEQKETYIDTTQDEAPGHILAVPVSAIKKIREEL